MHVRELRADELDEVVAFAAGLQQAITPGRIEPRMSLVMWEGDAIIGTVLCVSEAENRKDQRLRLLLAADRREDEALLRQLMDKALLKVRACGMARARIEPGPGFEAATFWASLNWQRYEQRAEAEGVSEPVVIG